MIQRMDNVGIVVDSLDLSIEFFEALGMTLQGRAFVGGDWAGRVTGLPDQKVEIAMLVTPDGHSKIELSQFVTPKVVSDHRDAPVNSLGYLRVMFAVDSLEATLTKLSRFELKLEGEVVRYEDSYLLCYVRGPGGILVGLAQEIS